MFEHFAERPKMAAQFMEMMTAYAAGQHTWTDENFYPAQKRLGDAEGGDEGVLLVDIGGNNGSDLVNFKADQPNLKGKLVLQDLPFVVSQVHLPGIEVMAYDFNTPQPIKGKKRSLNTSPFVRSHLCKKKKKNPMRFPPFLEPRI